MRKMLKRLFSFAIALTLVLSMVPAVDVSAATGTAWSGGSFSANGEYYLTGDITLSSAITVSKTVTLDLNGHTITVADGIRAFRVTKSLTIKDTGNGGTIQGSGTAYTANGGIIHVDGSNAVLNLESGTITGGKTAERGGNIYVENGTFNMTGGTVSNGYAGDRGGNIGSTGKVNISGGTVSGGEAVDYGGNIISTGANDYITLSGDGIITGGKAKNGGNITLMYSQFLMSGGTLSAGYATGNGGNLHTYGTVSGGRSLVNISGGTIEDVAEGSKGSAYLYGVAGAEAVVKISGGTLAGDTYACATASLTLSGNPVIDALRLNAGMKLTPANLTEGASICVGTASGYTIISGMLDNAAQYLPYFSAYKEGYSVGVVDNALTLVPECTCGCGLAPEAVTWKDLSAYAAGGELPGGHYYVPSAGLTLSSQLTVAKGNTVTLDLRGATLNAADDARAFYVYGTLNIMDSSEAETGVLAGGAVSGGNGGTVHAASGSVLNLLSGTISGGRAQRGGNIYATSATFNMYGGTVTGGVADQSLTTGSSTTNGRGGNIFLNKCTVNLAGGIISDGQSVNATNTYAGNIMISDGATEDRKSVTISGDIQIIGGSAKHGSSVALCYATVDMTGGTISGGVVYMYGTTSTGYSSMNISGGSIETLNAYQVEELNLSGKPVIERLILGAGMLATPNGLAEGAAICMDAADTVFTTSLESAESALAYFTAYDEGYVVNVEGDTLIYAEGCSCGCGLAESNVTWTSWSGGDITESGHYKVSKSFTLSGTKTLTAGLEVTIDLAGYTVTAASGARSFYVQGGSLTILDSVSSGKLVGSTYAGGYGGNIYVCEAGVVNLRSGTITGGAVSGNANDNFGGNIYVSNGTLNIYGGTITAGNASERGGNVFVNGSTSTMYMFGGSITNGTATNRGGNVFINGGKFYMTGGTVSGGSTTTSSYGGNLMATGMNSEIHISGTAVVKGGTASTGSNISLMYGNLYVSGGSIPDGTIHGTESSNSNYPGLYISGGTIGADITMTGDIEDGYAGLVAITGGTMTGTVKISYAKNFILSGAPQIANLTLGSTVRLTPVNITEGTSIPLTATGPFTTVLTDAERYIGFFAPTSGSIVAEDGVLAMHTNTASGTSGNITWQVTSGGTLILSGTGTMSNYSYNIIYNTIPWDDYASSITKIVIGKGITSIGNNAFRTCTKVTAVEIASTVTKIGTYAFYGNTSLTEINFPAKLTSIGNYAFTGCTGLTELTIPDTVTTIGTYTFQNCTGLNQVTLGTGISSIGNSAFNGCSALSTVNYRGSTTNWGSVSVGSNNTALTSAATFVYNHNSSGVAASGISWTLTGGNVLTVSGSGEMPGFYRNSATANWVGTPWSAYASQITSVVVSGLTSIGEWAFYDLDNLTSVTIPSTVTEISSNAFRDCDKLTTISIPASVTLVGDNAFYGCDKLASVTIGSGVKTIASYAFYGCSALTGVTIPAKVTTIGHLAFGECTGMTAITVNSSNTAYSGVNGVLLDKNKTTIIQVPGGYSGTYTAPDTVKTIAQEAFAGCSAITDITLPDSVTTVEAAAFFDCAATTITLGSGVAAIGSNAFGSCDDLLSFQVSKSNTAYAADATGALCSADLTTLVQVPGGISGSYSIANTATSVGENALAWNDKLTQVTVPAGVTSIGAYAFVAANAATLNMTATTTTVGKGAFEHTAVTTVNYTGTEKAWADTKIGNYNEPLLTAAVHYISSGTCGESLTWSVSTDGVLTISGTGDMRSFTADTTPWYAHNTAITAVVIEEGVTSIGASAFAGCTAMTNITVPATITTVGENAFASCNALTDVNYTGTYFQWQSVTLGDGNAALTEAAFQYANAALGAIRVKNQPTKLSYLVGETLDVTGLVLELVYNDGSTAEVTGVTSDYVVTADLTMPGTVPVTITYKEFSASFDVQVTAGGSCSDDGTSLTWTLVDGVLTITGTGKMTYYDAKSSVPWYAYRSLITSVVINEGMTGTLSRFAFYECANMTSVTLPEGITSLGSSAFYGCSSLQEVVIPTTVTGMSSTAFGSNTSLASVTMGEMLTSIGDGAFKNCTALTTVSYGGSRTSWSKITMGTENEALTNATITYAKAEIAGIRVSVLPTKTKYLISETLDSTGLELVYTYDDGVTESAFDGEYTVTCDAFTAIGEATATVTAGDYTTTFTVTVLPSGTCSDDGVSLTWKLVDGVLTISGTGTMTYYDSRDLVPWWDYKEQVTSVVVEDGMTGRLSRFAFYNCSNMESVSLPEGITFLGSSAFYGCSSLKEIVIPDSVTGLSSTVFGSNTSLTTVTMGEAVESVGEGAFKNCTALTTVYYGGSRTTWSEISINETENTCLTEANIVYARVDAVSITVTTLPTKVTYLVGEALDTTDMVVTKTFDDGSTKPVAGYEVSCDLTVIGEATATVTYEGFTTTFTVTVLPSGTTAEGMTWSIVEGVLSITYAAGENTTGAMADYTEEAPAPWSAYAEQVVSLVLGDGITAIGTNAFSGCTNMEAVIIPITVASIGENAFASCDALTTVNYDGTQAEWDAVTISETGNETLLKIAPKTEIVLGDLNNDGIVDTVDLTAIQAYVTGKTAEINIAASDINGDGIVDTVDLTAVQAYVAGKATTLG